MLEKWIVMKDTKGQEINECKIATSLTYNGY